MHQPTSRATARPRSASSTTIRIGNQVLDVLQQHPGRTWTARQVRAEIPSLQKPTTAQVAHALRRLYAAYVVDRVRHAAYALADSPQPLLADPAPLPAQTDRHVRSGCDPWRGRRDWYQQEARAANGVVDRHVWINSTCDTPMCLAHVALLRPITLDYQPGVCVYCGLPADTKDHLIPRGWSGDSARSWVLTVPACRECNSAIGAQWAPTITERRLIAHRFIRRRYRSHLTGSKLSRPELAEFGRNLRSVIEAHEDLREVTRGRLGWPGSDLYDLEAAWRSGIDDPYAVGLLTEVKP